MPGKEAQIAELEAVSAAPEFWNDQRAAQATMRRLTGLRDQMAEWRSLAQGLDDAEELLALGYRGKAIGGALDALLSGVIAGEAENDRAALLHYLAALNLPKSE